MIVLEWLFITRSYCDAAEPWKLGFQDPGTPIMQGIMDLHHDIFFFLILILVFVSWMLVRALWHFHYKTNPIPQRIVHGTTIEILRTIFPSIIRMFIAIPSFALLSLMDEVVVDPAITIKVIGHQWYRTYEYSDYNSSDEQSLTFDSYMIPEDDLELGQLRLLEVDNRVVVPAKTHLRFIVTSADVLHSWVVPSLGVKCDVVPGHLNQIPILVQQEGVYYGQCSEICGTNHAFMPIVVEAVPRKDYGSRVSNQLIPKGVKCDAVPSEGVKCDAVPSSISIQREGVYYGQCTAIKKALSNIERLVKAIVEESLCWQPLSLTGLPLALARGNDHVLDQGPPFIAIPPTPEILELPIPLMTLVDRSRELQHGLGIHFTSTSKDKNLADWKVYTLFIQTLDLQIAVEIKIEAALVDDGMDPNFWLARRREIRSIIFYRGEKMVSKSTLESYLDSINHNGTRSSVPYKKVCSALQNYHLF